MKQMTMLELYKENLASGKALFPSADFNFMTEYNTNFAKYDKLFARNRHFFYYKDIFADANSSNADVLEDFQFDVNALLVTKQDSLQKIWDASRIEYSPLENYDATENFTDTTVHSANLTNSYGNVNRENLYGAREDEHAFGAETRNGSVAKTGTETTAESGTDTITNGAKTTTNQYGIVTETENIGAVSESDGIGARTDSTTNGVAGYNASSFTNSDSSTTENGAQSNTHTENAKTNSKETASHTDSVSEGQHIDENAHSNNNTLTHNVTDTTQESVSAKTDKDNYGQHTDTESITRANDTSTNSENTTFNHEFKRHGNIGVTTSQQMLQSEFDLRLNFNFYDVVFDLIIKELCNYSDSGFDAFLTPLMNNLLEGDE